MNVLFTASPPRRDRAMRNVLGVALLSWLVVGVAATAFADDGKVGVEFFERKIRPLLAKRCYECHSSQSKTLQGELSLENRAGILQGGETGSAVVAGKPDDSLLIAAVRYDGDVQMPPAGKLPADEIALLVEWVRGGAALPDDGSTKAAQKSIDFAAGRRFWSFQPPQTYEPPAVKIADWSRRKHDAFVLAALEQRGLSPASAAEKRQLLRRATFDLLGLPPSPEEVEAFEADEHPRAFAQRIDRAFASPQYGERWGRFWLDLTRFADSNETSLEERPKAWLYRDWVVQAFCRDVPYDEFVRLQLAADQLPDHVPSDLAALGFLGISPAYFKELKLAPAMIKAIVSDEWEERMDAVGRTFLGLTLACARCHDHKFDPISIDDYYALAGVIANTRLTDRSILPAALAAAVREAQKQVAAFNEKIKKLKASKELTPEEKAELSQAEAEARRIELETPHYAAAIAHGVDDAAMFVLPNGPNATKLEFKPGEAVDLQIQLRGNPLKLGAVVPRRFLTVLSDGPAKPFPTGSGRLDLAQAILNEGRPLSARVIVNRVWKHHFGRGLVDTPSDFGTQGGRPSHPELLDDLTARFVEHGWSMKWLHREIMLSATYQQASTYNAAHFAVDPDNRLLWRMNRRRLDVEAWRDAMLAASGTLDTRLGGPPVTLADVKNRRRTLYGKISRADLDTTLRLFDFPDPSTHSPDREPTTTALQQLYVLNNPFIAAQSAALTRRIQDRSPPDVAAQVRELYRVLFARGVTEKELAAGVRFLTSAGQSPVPNGEVWNQYAQALLGSNEFLFVD